MRNLPSRFALLWLLLCAAPTLAADQPSPVIDNSSSQGDIADALKGPKTPSGVIMRGVRRKGQVSASGAAFQINFAFASSELVGDGPELLRKIGAAMQQTDLADVSFLIVGHTDGVGTPEHNLALSIARARTVQKFLIEQSSVVPARLRYAGCGETKLMNSTDERAPENRRVEIVNLRAEASPVLTGCAVD